MSETWYRVEGWRFCQPTITPVEVVKETKTQIEIRRLVTSFWRVGDQTPRYETHRQSKDTDYCCFFKTWNEAHNFLMQMVMNRIEALRKEMVDVKACQDRVSAMVEPEVEA